jgi:urease beta subunit
MPRPSDLLLGVGGQPARAAVSSVSMPIISAMARPARRHSLPVRRGSQRKGQVLAHRHGVVDDRELEHLRDVALGVVGAVTSSSSNRCAPGRVQQARNDVEQRGLAAARGAEQRIGLAIGPDMVHLLQRPVGIAGGFRQVGMRQVRRA